MVDRRPQGFHVNVLRVFWTRGRPVVPYRLTLVLLIGIAALFVSSVARAEFLDEILVQRVGNDAVIEVRFSLRVQYLRHFPKEEGDVLRVSVALVAVDGLPPLAVREIRRSPQTG